MWYINKSETKKRYLVKVIIYLVPIVSNSGRLYFWGLQNHCRW